MLNTLPVISDQKIASRYSQGEYRTPLFEQLRNEREKRGVCEKKQKNWTIKKRVQARVL